MLCQAEARHRLVPLGRTMKKADVFERHEVRETLVRCRARATDGGLPDVTARRQR